MTKFIKTKRNLSVNRKKGFSFLGFKITLKVINLSLILLILLIGVLYLGQTNAAATKGYRLKELQQTLAQLEKENMRLKIQTTELQSIQNIQARLQEQKNELTLVEVAQSDYITHLKNSFLAAR